MSTINVVYLSSLVTKAIIKSSNDSEFVMSDQVEKEILFFCERINLIANGVESVDTICMNDENDGLDSISQDEQRCFSCGLKKSEHNARHPFVNFDGTLG